MGGGSLPLIPRSVKESAGTLRVEYPTAWSHRRDAVALPVGTRLGSYEVLAPLGAGGMGEVYRARDAKLDREVAVKVLPERVASDPETLARFEREAKAVAALSHPNILSIFDFGAHNGTAYAVTELLEGETLRARLARGALPLRRALECAQHIALGLAAAHDKGIVHRDLKPDNVFLTRDGRVKILDFGLARQQPKPAEDAWESPTVSKYTDPGTVLGTVGYMSPEQIRGVSVDARSDVFSFGSLLYEMLTGERAFQRDAAAETMTAILKDEPKELASPEETLPQPLARILRRCLAKDPAARVQSAHDLAFELDLIGAQSGPARPLTPRARAGGRAVAGIVGILLGLLTAWAVLFATGRLPSAGASGPLHVSITLPSADVLSWVLPHAVISPDGKTIVYSAERDGKPQLWLRRLDEDAAKPITGAEEGRHPVFSPDGQWIGFWVQSAGTLKRVSIGGGPARDVTKAFDLRGASWAPDGSLVFAPDKQGGLMRLPPGGGTPTPLTTPDKTKGEESHVWPQVLPDGTAALFTVEIAGKPFDEARIECVEL